jgi:hypothetical protein
MDIECDSLLSSNRIDHRRWVDYNKDNDEIIFESPVLLALSSYQFNFPSPPPSPHRGEGKGEGDKILEDNF